jgi:protein tyrosine phosphatase (PTP) superfamily phosphohydrolase (DUF442 family)
VRATNCAIGCVALGIVLGGTSLLRSADNPHRLDAPPLPNAWQLTPQVISGGLPEGDEAFAQLAKLGVRTIISVDGARPDVARARRFHMRYIHLPHGYDGITKERSLELARAVRDFPGPVYIHCHHGKHRSPAAAVVACVQLGTMAPQAAQPLLEQIGTSPDYRGLYEAAARAHPQTQETLDAVAANFPEVAQIPELAAAMVELEQTFGHLQLLAKHHWQTPPQHAALQVTHEALLLREHYTEMLRLPDLADRSAAFRTALDSAQHQAQQLEHAAKAYASQPHEAARATLQATFLSAQQNCHACHRAHRDAPRSPTQPTTQ